MASNTNISADYEQKYATCQKTLQDIQTKQDATRKELAGLASKGDEAFEFTSRLRNFADEFYFSLKGQDGNYYNSESHREHLEFEDDLLITRNTCFADIDRQCEELEAKYRKLERSKEELMDRQVRERSMRK